MQKSQKGPRPTDSRQLDFLALLEGVVALPPPPRRVERLDFNQHMRRALNEAIKAGPFANRESLAEAVSPMAGRVVTKAMLDSWTGASRPHALPAAMVAPLSLALGNSILVNAVAEPAGCAVSESADLIQSRVERLGLFIRFAKAEQRRLIAATPLFQGRLP